VPYGHDGEVSRTAPTGVKIYEIERSDIYVLIIQ